MLVEKDLPLDSNALLADAVPAFGDKIQDATGSWPTSSTTASPAACVNKASARKKSTRCWPCARSAWPWSRSSWPPCGFRGPAEAPALAAANKRVGNILKKAEAEGPVDAHVNPNLLQEKAEQDLYAALQRFVPEANAQFDAGDYTASLQTLAVLRAPVDAFFDDDGQRRTARFAPEPPGPAQDPACRHEPRRRPFCAWRLSPWRRL